MKTLFMKSYAGFSDCGTYRYFLSRTWNGALPTVSWVMLNPSTADEKTDDPTIRRCMGFAESWGCGGIRVVNLFAYRATSPAALLAAVSPVGPDNEKYLRLAASFQRHVVAAWGVHGAHLDRDAAFMALLAREGIAAECLGLTKDGHPRHPLYVRGAQQLVPFTMAPRPVRVRVPVKETLF